MRSCRAAHRVSVVAHAVRAALVLTMLPTPVRAQAPSGLSLQTVVDAALTGNTQIRNEYLRAQGLRGEIVARNAPFDLQMQSTVQQGRDKKAISLTQFGLEQSTSYQLAFVRQLRSGIRFSPTVQVTSAQYAVAGMPTTGSASASLSVIMPLKYDRGGAVTNTAVRVAELDFETVQESWRANVGIGVANTVNAYWTYLASVAGVAAQRDAEARAQRLLDQTTELVAQQERAPSDLQQIRATVAARRSARILAEQAVDQARVQLGTLMGLNAMDVIKLAAPITGFPEPIDVPTATPESVARLETIARNLRPDLTAHRVSNRAWELELEEFRSAEQPLLNLNVNLGYEGFTQGPGYQHLVSPLYHNVPGLNASVQLQYGLAINNSAAHGRVMTEAASLEQQRIALRDVERQVITDVSVAALGVDRGARALHESENAVALFRATVENEQRKLQLGVNTLFDVLNAEDALTNALLTAINNRRNYAISLASLRLATGTLADVSGDVPRVDAARILTQP